MNPNQPEPMSSVQKQLHTVTPFSKLLALFIFITLPFVGFWLGRQYPVQPTPVSNEEIEVDSTGSGSETPETEIDSDTTATNQPANTVAQPTPVAPTGPTEITVQIEAMTLDSMTVDNIAIYEGEAAVQRMIADGLCTAAEPQKCTLTGGQYIRNTDPTVRTYPLSPEVEVLTWTGGDYALSQLVNRAQTNAPYTITINGGLVTKIQQVYRP